MTWDVLITYDYAVPPTPQEVMVINGGRPKCNYRVVAEGIVTREEGERIGQTAFVLEMIDLRWLLNDPVLQQLEVDEHYDRKAIYRWYEGVDAEYKSRLDAHRQEYADKIEARRQILIARHKEDHA